jgi:hypothetical protein
MPTSLIAYTAALHSAFGSFHSTLGGEVAGAPGRGTGAGACPRGHCRLAACPGDRILRIRSRILGPIYSLRAATHVRRAMRSFVTSVSGSRSSPDLVIAVVLPNHANRGVRARARAHAIQHPSTTQISHQRTSTANQTLVGHLNARPNRYGQAALAANFVGRRPASDTGS